MTYIDMDCIDHIDSITVCNAHIGTVCERQRVLSVIKWPYW